MAWRMKPHFSKTRSRGGRRDAAVAEGASEVVGPASSARRRDQGRRPDWLRALAQLLSSRGPDAGAAAARARNAFGPKATLKSYSRPRCKSSTCAVGHICGSASPARRMRAISRGQAGVASRLATVEAASSLQRGDATRRLSGPYPGSGVLDLPVSRARMGTAVLPSGTADGRHASCRGAAEAAGVIGLDVAVDRVGKGGRVRRLANGFQPCHWSRLGALLQYRPER